MHSIKELQALSIWKYLGEKMQETLTQDFELLPEKEQEVLFGSLQSIEQVKQEMIQDGSGEAGFAFVLQKALVNVMDELMHEVKDIRHKHFVIKETTERKSEVSNAEDLLDQME